MGRPGGFGTAHAALTAALAIGVAVLLLVLYRGSGDDGKSARVSATPDAGGVEATDAAPSVRSDPVRPPPAPPPAQPRSAPEPSDEDEADEEAPEAEPPSSDPTASYIEAQLARGRSELRRAAATCLREDYSARDEDLLVIEYTLVGRRGALRPVDLEVLQSNLGDRDLEECILERIDAVEWTADGPEIRVVVPDSFTVQDLENLSP